MVDNSARLRKRHCADENIPNSTGLTPHVKDMRLAGKGNLFAGSVVAPKPVREHDCAPPRKKVAASLADRLETVVKGLENGFLRAHMNAALAKPESTLLPVTRLPTVLANIRKDIAAGPKHFKVITQKKEKISGDCEALLQQLEECNDRVLWQACAPELLVPLNVVLQACLVDAVMKSPVPDLPILIMKKSSSFLVDIPSRRSLARCNFTLSTTGRCRKIELGTIAGFLSIERSTSGSDWKLKYVFLDFKLHPLEPLAWEEMASVLMEQTGGRAGNIGADSGAAHAQAVKGISDQLGNAGYSVIETGWWIASSARSGLATLTSAASARASEAVYGLMDQVSTAISSGPSYQPLETNDLDAPYEYELRASRWSSTEVTPSKDRCYDPYQPYGTPIPITHPRPQTDSEPIDYVAITGTPYQAEDAGFVNDEDVNRAFEDMQSAWDIMFPNRGNLQERFQSEEVDDLTEVPQLTLL